jgi:hypothetical protein
MPPNGNEPLRSQHTKTIYPNPVQDVLHVDVAESKKIQVIDVSGRVLFEETGLNSVEIDLTGLKPGTYFVSVDGRVRMFRKF